MRYEEMIRNNGNKNEQAMWRSVEHVSDLICRLEETMPDLAREFLIEEWESLHGPHYDETMAREVVEDMWHLDENGVRVCGEMVCPEACGEILNRESKESLLWDAYVGVNGFAHDFARCGMNRDSLMDMAQEFWFGDDDFDGSDKVWWYYSNK